MMIIIYYCYIFKVQATYLSRAKELIIGIFNSGFLKTKLKHCRLVEWRDAKIRQNIDIPFYDSFYTPSSNKVLALALPLILIIPSVYQNQAFQLGVLISFVNIFHFNLIVKFVCFTFVSSVINLIYSKQLVLQYKAKMVPRLI